MKYIIDSYKQYSSKDSLESLSNFMEELYEIICKKQYFVIYICFQQYIYVCFSKYVYILIFIVDNMEYVLTNICIL